MSFKGVIFDLDGVLVDTVPLHFDAWKRMFNEYGYDFNQEIYQEKVDGRPRLDGVRGVMSTLDEDELIEAGKRKQGYYLEMINNGQLQAFVSSMTLIRQLRKQGIRLATASSSVNASCILEKLGVLGDFDTVVTADDVSVGKPHPEIFLTAAQRLNLAVSDCVVFEDAVSGVQAAKAGNFFCIAVDRHKQPDKFEHADIVIQDAGEIEGALFDHLFQ